MNNRMRDLEQIQERDPDDRGRRIGTLVMAGLTLVGLSSALGVVVGRAAQPGEETAIDPLAQLQLGNEPAGAEPADEGKLEAPEIEATDMTFPSTLSEQDERPEVAAALAAAAREEADLAQLDAPAAPAPAAPAPSDAEIVRTLPASIAAGPASRKLPRTAQHDRLVAAALPARTPAELAPEGEEGEFTLQVISYDTPAKAKAFAEGLRAKGHQAFVTEADVEGRGHFFRVRIGPFKWRHQARSYRQRFETEEGIHTFVVRRPREQRTG